LFDADFNKTKRGFQRLGSLTHPKNSNFLLWWPSEKTRGGWINNLNSSEDEIIETRSEETKKVQHYKSNINSEQKRIVFFHHKDILGITSYKFKGIFAYDSHKSNPNIGRVWKRIGESLILNLTTEAK
jgi:hypothetical protein